MQDLNPWLMLLIGLLIGLIVAWFLGRRKSKALEGQVAQIQGDLKTRTDELATCRNRATTLQSDCDGKLKALQGNLDRANASLAATQSAADARIKAIEVDLQARAAELSDAQSRLEGLATRSAGVAIAATGFTQEEADDLTKIKGIGPAFASRLSASGIRTYSDLANADPQELEKVIEAREWQKVDTAEWVSEAKRLAGRPRPVEIGDDLTSLEGIGPTYATRLRAAGITTFAQLAETDEATLAEIVGAPAWRRPEYGDWIAQAKLAAAGDEAGLKALQAELFSRKGDNLELLENVGANGAAALKKAGVTSFAALAALIPDQLKKIYGDAGLRSTDFDAVLAEAKLRAVGKRIPRATRSNAALRVKGGTAQRSCPQDLEAIKGIGTVYEQRLYAVGIGTYWETGMLTDAQLTEILEVQEFQDVNFVEIKAEAMRLAAETGTMGHTWDGTEPDNFEPLEGIGPVAERRLYGAGVCTYAALAQMTEVQLAEICKMPEFAKPNYGRWIEQARQLSAQHGL